MRRLSAFHPRETRAGEEPAREDAARRGRGPRGDREEVQRHAARVLIAGPGETAGSAELAEACSSSSEAFGALDRLMDSAKLDNIGREAAELFADPIAAPG